MHSGENGIFATIGSTSTKGKLKSILNLGGNQTYDHVAQLALFSVAKKTLPPPVITLDSSNYQHSKKNTASARNNVR